MNKAASKKTALIFGGLFLISSFIFPDAAFCKKGGIGQGGGYSDGTLYHSHSDRSYSGRDVAKGKGKGLNKAKTGKKSKKGRAANDTAVVN